MEFLEFEGKTTEEAIQHACEYYQVSPEKLEIEIVTVGSPGIFGLGSRKARVRVTRREEAEPDLKSLGQELLEKFLEKMGECGKVSGHQEDDRLYLSIDTEEAGLLIGKQGQTLEALQYLLTKMLVKKSRRKVRLAIDIESYRARHQQNLSQLALRYGEKVKKSGRPVTLNPMNPHDRRIIHLTLQDDKDLKTMSRGEGLYKKVVIYPARKKELQGANPGLA